MPRKKKSPAGTATLESPAQEPKPIADVLAESPIAALVADQAAKTDEPGAEAVAAFQRQRERELAVAEQAPPDREILPSGPRGPRGQTDEPEQRVPTSFVEAVKASKAAFAPIPEGFLNVDSFPAAGLKVNRSLDRKVASIQFAEDRLPTRAEKDILEDVGGKGKGFVYKAARRQWERYDPENPVASLVDAKRVGADLARDREELGR